MRKYFDLTNPLWRYSPKTPFHMPPNNEVEFFENTPLVRTGILSQGIRVSLHYGTHIDSPRHFGYPMTLDAIPLETLCGTGVVLDIKRDDWGIVTGEDLAKASPSIQNGDRVVLNTGWHRFFDDDPERYMLRWPGLDKSGVDWLVEKRVSWVGSDTPSPQHCLGMSDNFKGIRPDLWTAELIAGIDPKKFPGQHYCHKTLLKNNIPLIEQVGGSIDDVTGKRVTLMALPPKYKYAEASQVRVIAIEET
jgi:kynurenine formamidase